MRILLADDIPEVRSALRLLLEQEPELQVVGFTHDLQGLLEQMGSCQFEVVLLDWEFSSVRAVHLLRVIRYLCPGTRVVALSGRLEARGESLAAGVDAFTSKGYPPTTLLSILHAWEEESIQG